MTMQESSHLFFQMKRQAGEGRVCAWPVYCYAHTLKYQLEFGAWQAGQVDEAEEIASTEAWQCEKSGMTVFGEQWVIQF